jgi:hypothetical protein
MPKSKSPGIWDHTGHNIGASDPQPATELFGESPRPVPGNAWCLDCDVPVAAEWTRDLGVKVHREHQAYLTSINYKPHFPPPELLTRRAHSECPTLKYPHQFTVSRFPSSGRTSWTVSFY